MAEESVTVNVKLLDREFLVGCKPDEREGLLAAVEHLNRKMREIRHAARSPGYDRIAVLAALDVTHDLLMLQRSQNQLSSTAGEQIAMLRRKLEDALEAPIE
ncbi:MAG TPA: cell division protein ZapA [Rhodanobacteraceae bacterium]|jgi:cell division protein ZapA|nr:cell division protein ZapA [Rhodanobacteraceae bacterium]